MQSRRAGTAPEADRGGEPPTFMEGTDMIAIIVAFLSELGRLATNHNTTVLRG
jgi:hypothetical protein